MRPSVLTPLVAAVGLGGAALAQPLLVVDPWQRSTASDEANSWFEPTAPKVAPDADTPTAMPSLERETQPSTAKTNGEAPPWSEPRASAPLASEFVIDPWSASAPPASLDARSGRGSWASRVVEVVDPWKRGATVAADTRLRLVVDPWAR